jgi:integrase
VKIEAVGNTDKQLKEDAENKARNILNRYKSGENLDAGKMTVNDFLEQWLNEYVTPNLRPKTIKWYTMIIKAHISPVIGNIQLAKLNSLHIQRLYNESEAKDTTLRGIHKTLHAAFERGYKWGLVQENIMNRLDTPKVKRRKYVTFSAKQAITFLNTAKSVSKNYGFYLTALTTGMRLNEIAGLKWDDIDFKKMTIRVDEQLTNEEYDVELFGPVKTTKSNGKIPMVNILADELKRIQKVQNDERKKVEREAKLKEGPLWEDYNLIFTQIKNPGRPIDSKNLSKREFKELVDLTFIQLTNPNIKASWLNADGINELKKQIEIPNIRFHDLRHSTATLLRELGVDMKTISEILRHSSLAITDQIYVHENVEIHRPALEKLEQLFANQNFIS